MFMTEPLGFATLLQGLVDAEHDINSRNTG